MNGISRFLPIAVLGLAAASASAQLGNMDAKPAPKAYVVYAAEAQAVVAGKPAVLALRFHIMDGYHVNSHTPKSEFLIPTAVKVEAVEGVKTGALEYPAGKLFSFSFEPGEKLDVYAGDFTVKLPVTATSGEHTLNATLNYQACDNAACYPPKSIPVKVLFTAK